MMTTISYEKATKRDKWQIIRHPARILDTLTHQLASSKPIRKQFPYKITLLNQPKIPILAVLN